MVRTLTDSTRGSDGRKRVLVVDDSPFMRKAISRMLNGDPALQVVGTACDGLECLRQLRDLKPDVMTLDIMMPNMDGLTVLKEVMSTEPIPIVMLSSLTTEDAEVTLRALELGAVDIVDKPATLTNMDVFQIGPELIEKVKAAAGVAAGTLVRLTNDTVVAAGAAPAQDGAQAPSCDIDCIVIGASTGGPSALQRIIARLPADASIPVAIVQHMPEGFTSALASRLRNIAPIPVKEADDGDLLCGGRVILARSGMQMHFERRRDDVVVRLDRTPPDTAHMPSIDVTMASAAEVFGPRALGVLMTGMGTDGARGLLAMRQAGAPTIAEAETSAVIYGMPRAAADLGAASEMLDILDVCDRVAGASRP